MERLLPSISRVPDLLGDIFKGKYALVAFLITVIYLLILFLNNKVTHLLREILVPILAVTAAIGYFRRNYPLFWLMLFMLAILAAVTLLKFFLVTIRQNYINRKIEKRALEKARMRRGSWKDKRAYSGDSANIDDQPAKFEDMNSAEISDVVYNETSENQGANVDITPLADESDGTAATSKLISPDTPLGRSAVMDAVSKLESLHEIGVISDEELDIKRSELYGRMG